MVEAMTESANAITPTTGDWAFDREQLDDPDEDPVVLVVDTTTTRADEYVIHPMPDGEADWTVAGYNRDYDPSEPVILAVYRKSIETTYGTDVSRQEILKKYNNDNLKERLIYAFPESRLDKID